MQRTIVQPPQPGPAALADLKHWLAITREQEDAALTGLLHTSLALCEAFTGQTPLVQTIEEIVPLAGGVHRLAVRPVRQLLAAEVIAADGVRTPAAPNTCALDLGVDGSAAVRVLLPLMGRGLALRLVVGLAADWAALPPPLRHGIVRLAAHHYRDRDREREQGSARTALPPPPPASVTALWRPWRTVRLA